MSNRSVIHVIYHSLRDCYLIPRCNRYFCETSWKLSFAREPIHARPRTCTPSLASEETKMHTQCVSPGGETAEREGTSASSEQLLGISGHGVRDKIGAPEPTTRGGNTRALAIRLWVVEQQDCGRRGRGPLVSPAVFCVV